MVEVSWLLHLVASVMDGKRSAEAIASAASIEMGRRLSAADVDYLIDHKLRPLGVVHDPSDIAPPTPDDRALLALSVRTAVLPERVVRRVTTWLRPLFLPGVVVAALASAAAVDAWIVVGHRLDGGVSELLHRPGLVVMTATLMVLAGVFHELGHATACRYGGARPGVIGAGIYLIWPVFYNDLNDSYRLSRADRLRADLGGVYFNVLFILVLAGAYGITGFRPLLVVLALQHLLILQQFLPFVRLDGYYIVSDVAGVPDLFAHVRPVLSTLVPWNRRSTAVPTLRPRARLVVTVWALTTVPLLAACMVLLVVGLPGLLRAAWHSTGVQADALTVALQGGAALDAVVGALQLLILVVPLAGLGLTLARRLLSVRRRDAANRLSGAHAPVAFSSTS